MPIRGTSIDTLGDDFLKLDCSNDPLTGELETQAIKPDGDNTRDIGVTSTGRYKDLYLAGNITDDTKTVAVGNLIDKTYGEVITGLFNYTTGLKVQKTGSSVFSVALDDATPKFIVNTTDLHVEVDMEVHPLTDDTHNLGKAGANGDAVHWKDIYLSGLIYRKGTSAVDVDNLTDRTAGDIVSGLWRFTSGLQIQDTDEGLRVADDGDSPFFIARPEDGYMVFHGWLRPGTDDTYDIGSSSLRWQDLYLSGNISDATNTVTVANLKTAYDYSQVGHLPLAGGTMTGNVNFAAYYWDIGEIAAPANPGANVARFYCKDDGGTTKLYFRDSAGSETELGSGGASDHDALNNLNWAAAGHTIDAAVDFSTNALNNCGTISVNATADHTIADSTDDLKITNPNSNKDIILNVNDNGTTHDFVTLDSSALRFILNNDSSVTAGTFGIMQVTGTWTGTSAAMYFNPTWNTPGAFVGFDIAPALAAGVAGTAIRFEGTCTGNQTMNFLQFQPGARSTDSDATYSRYTENITVFLLDGDDGNMTINPIAMGGTRFAQDTGSGVTGDVDETMIKLTGGATVTRSGGGTTGTVTQKGIHFTNFGAITEISASGAADIKALYADGGIFEHDYDYDDTPTATGNGAIILGNGQNWGIGNVASSNDLKFDQLVGSGVVDFGYAGTATGSTAATLGNVPAGATGAQNEWLAVKVNGNTRYIPCWA